jgi:hypothetical protein
MINRAARLTGLAVCLALSLGTPQRTLAAIFPLLHTHPRPLRGVVVQASSRSLQIQTANNTASVLLSKHTQIFRVVTGSLADLKTREIVTVNVTPGTTDVQQVVISPQMAGAHPHHDRRGDHRHQGQKPPPMQPSDPGVYRNVQIVSLANNKMQVRDGHGNTAAFPIDNNTKVTKILRGSWHDLAVGESVLVFPNSDGFAISVKILSS